MGGSLSKSRRIRNGYLELHPSPPPSPFPRIHDLNGHHPSYPSTSNHSLNNDVNLHRHSIRLNLDPNNPGHHLISFNFDASCDGRIRIIYLAKEEENCRFTSLFPQASEPIAFPFQIGLRQKFCQPSGTGIDLGLFELDDLSNYSPGLDVFPLVVCAETDSLVEDASPSMQITQAVLYKSDGTAGAFQVKVVKQILWIDPHRYELMDFYGSGFSSDLELNDPGKDCVICLIEPRDTAVLPCLHMCICMECVKALQDRSNKCPICHNSIEKLIQIRFRK